MKSQEASKGYAKRHMDWVLYEDSLVAKYIAGGMGILEARSKARDMMNEQERIRKDVAAKAKEAKAANKKY